MKPQFFIIAGPNGAGKSTYGHEHVPPNTYIFNGDLIYAELLKKYPAYDPEKLQGGVPTRLEKERDEAIAQRRDFGFESNYANDLATEITDTFKKAGYETNLIYFGLPNIDTATKRVVTRILLGGHNIANTDIRYNFEEGTKRVKDDLHRYDRIMFVDTDQTSVSQLVAFYLHYTGKAAIMNSNIGWFNSFFRDKVLDLAARRITEISSNLAQKMGGEEERNDISKGFRRGR